MVKQIYIIVACLVFVFIDVDAQIDNGSLDPFGRPILIDTSNSENDTIINKNGFFSLFKGKPGKAAFYSLVIPSGGQVYNRRWWKVPIALGIDGGLTYVLIHNRSQYREAQELYETALVEMDPLASRYKEARDYYRKWSEYAWVWLVAGHLMTVIDAYVDRHLMDFDISPDLSIAPVPGFGEQNISTLHVNAGIKVNFSKKSTKSPNPLLISR